MHHCGPGCHAERWICCLEGQNRPCNQNIIVSTISLELLILLQGLSDLLWWYIVISRSVFWKDWIAVHVWGHGHSDGSKLHWLSVLHFLYHLYLCNQTRCVDVVIIIGVISIAPYLTDKDEYTMLNKTSQITRLGANKVGMYICIEYWL